MVKHISSNSWYTVETSCTNIIVLLIMSDNAPTLFGIRTRNQFVISRFNAVFQDVRLHDHWWQTRYQLEGNIEVKKAELLRIIIRAYHEKSIEGTYLWLPMAMNDSNTSDTTSKQGKKAKSRWSIFQVTAGVVPKSYPTTSNSITW